MFGGADWLLEIGVLANDSLTIEDGGTLPPRILQVFSRGLEGTGS